MNKPVFLIMPSAAKISIRNLRKRGTVITQNTACEFSVQLYKYNNVLIKKAVF